MTDPPALVSDAPIRLLLAEADPAIRQLVRGWLRSHPDILIIGEARDGAEALRLSRSLQPDLLLLAVHMPMLSGAELVGILRREKGPPAVMLASSGAAGITAAMQAMRAGAVDFLAIPTSPSNPDDQALQQALVQRLRNQTHKDHSPPAALRLPQHPFRSNANKMVPGGANSPDLLVIGVSTGGPEAVRDLLANLKPTACPILIAQHMPVSFTNGFARSLTRQLGLQIVESHPGMVVSKGAIVVLRGGEDWTLMRAATGALSLRPAQAGTSVHHPSVDRLFQAAAECARRPVGVILTGMGEDGTEGARALARLGRPVLAQDPVTCAVGGMPGSAIRAGVVNDVLPIAGLARALNILLSTDCA